MTPPARGSRPAARASGGEEHPSKHLARILPQPGPVTTLTISSLLRADSPRLAGEQQEHIKALMECSYELPPVLVHTPSLRVIDGMHRLRAAEALGRKRITARLVPGSTEQMFLLAVSANLAGGLGLSVQEREAAAARILSGSQQWSDRAVAAATGLSAARIATIRQRVVGPSQARRIGQDGRSRPVDAATGRRRASEILTAHPEESLRKVARRAGASLATVRDVRDRLRRGEDPLPPRLRGEGREAAGARTSAGTGTEKRAEAVAGRTAGTGPDPGSTNPTTILAALKQDPSMLSNQNRLTLLRRLMLQARGAASLQALVEHVPAHRAEDMATLATAFAHEWLEMARQMRIRAAMMDHAEDIHREQLRDLDS